MGSLAEKLNDLLRENPELREFIREGAPLPFYRAILSLLEERSMDPQAILALLEYTREPVELEAIRRGLEVLEEGDMSMGTEALIRALRYVYYDHMPQQIRKLLTALRSSNPPRDPEELKRELRVLIEYREKDRIWDLLRQAEERIERGIKEKREIVERSLEFLKEIGESLGLNYTHSPEDELAKRVLENLGEFSRFVSPESLKRFVEARKSLADQGFPEDYLPRGVELAQPPGRGVMSLEEIIQRGKLVSPPIKGYGEETTYLSSLRRHGIEI